MIVWVSVPLPAAREILGDYARWLPPDDPQAWADALAGLPRRERYLALEQRNARYDVGVKYGLLNAQLALALDGVDREEVLALLLELLAQRELARQDGD